MINNEFRTYSYYVYGEEDSYGQKTFSTIDEYGQPVEVVVPEGEGTEEETTPCAPAAAETELTAKIAIYVVSQTASDNILYKDATYIGLTYDDLNDDCVIDYNGTLLKVIYVIPNGRLNQLFMVNM